MRGARALLLAWILAVAPEGAGAWSGAPPPDDAAPPLDARLLLVGDAGDATPEDPVLRALAAEAAREADRTLVVFLGDNIYPYGLPEVGTRDRREAEGRIRAQIDAVRASGARALFVPGNHDWQKSGKDGWSRVKRQADLVNAASPGRVLFRPQGGCPGPEVVEAGARLRVVALDTQWWLHPAPRPASPGDGCRAVTEEAVVEELRRALLSPGGDGGARVSVVVAHHPLRTGGVHGGAFGFKQHVFPLTEAVPWLWLPLPLVGSVYPLARRNGASDQDVSGARYRHLVRRMEEAMRDARPLAWAAGHEHALQVLRDAGGLVHLVSGAGTIDNVSRVRALPETLFARASPGFQRLDVHADGSVVLTVVGVSREGAAAPLHLERLR